jgi:hypothetical protein
VTLSGLAEGTTYYWQIRAINAAGMTYANASTWWSFTTQVGRPGDFNKSAPANGGTGQSTSPTLSWTAAVGATSYEYCYDTTDDAACSAGWTNVGNVTSATVSGLAVSTTYYWQVRAKNAGGTTYANAGAWWSFTTQTGSQKGTATRSLPGCYGTGAVSVSIVVVPNSTVLSYAVQESPPTGWAVTAISDGGAWDDTNKQVKWGPFFDNTTRTLTYQATPPSGTTGPKTFSGQASFDGTSVAIGGASSLDVCAQHPADTYADMRMVIDEVTAYGAAWRGGVTWPAPPNPIPINYVTRAGYLWRRGESYVYVGGECPSCWVPGITATTRAGVQAVAAVGTATSDMAAAYRPGVAMTVRLSIVPASSTLAWAVEDRPPTGWVVSTISHSGQWDTVNGKIKWGPFFDATARTVSYVVTPPTGETGTKTFSGIASFDGTNVAIGGVRSVARRVLGNDFNADGKADLVWRNRITGEVIFWLMNGTTVASEVHMPAPADRNAKIVAIADLNDDGNPDLIWRNQKTGANHIWYMNGTSYVSAADIITVADQRWEIVAAADFNGDGKPDLLWRSRANGDVVVWYMNGATYTGYAWVSSIADLDWQIEAAEDFNADGNPDLLWRNRTTGDIVHWYMNGASYAGYALLAPEPDLNWMIAAVEDANGDGNPDIVWHNVVTGENKVTYMNGATAISSDVLPNMTDAECEAVGAAAGRTRGGFNDFNADSWPDIVWHNTTTGENRIWYMNGATSAAEGTLATEPDLNWRSVAVADFNGDGLPDIVWRNADTGENRIWLMTGRAHTGDMTLPTIADTSWRVVGAADFNRDGHPDLVWRNQSTGANVIWFLVNGVYAGWTAPPTIADTNWRIVGVGDFNGDGWPDLMWRNQATGVNVAWFLVNGVYAGWAAPPTIADTTWQIVGVGDFNNDGEADLLWRNQTDGRNLVWHLDNGAYVDFAWLPTLSTDWKTGPGQ